MCKSRISGSSIEHFYNNNFQSNVLNALNLTRDNTNDQQNYFQITQTTNTYLIMAYGSLGSKIIFKIN